LRPRDNKFNREWTRINRILAPGEAGYIRSATQGENIEPQMDADDVKEAQY